MSHIVLTDEQTRILTEAQGAVDLRDGQGRTLASASPLSEMDLELIARAKRSKAKGGPYLPSATVQAHFKRLEEIAAQEDLTESRTLELLQRMRAGEQV